MSEPLTMDHLSEMTLRWLLEYIESCRPSSYTPWRDPELADMRARIIDDLRSAAAVALRSERSRLAALEAAGEQLADVVDSYMYRKLSRVCPEAARAAWRQAKGETT